MIWHLVSVRLYGSRLPIPRTAPNGLSPGLECMCVAMVVELVGPLTGGRRSKNRCTAERVRARAIAQTATTIATLRCGSNRARFGRPPHGDDTRALGVVICNCVYTMMLCSYARAPTGVHVRMRTRTLIHNTQRATPTHRHRGTQPMHASFAEIY